jgi:ribA/ribD-fused uncharacterized protein
MTTHYNIDWLTERFESGDTLKFIFFWGHTNNNNETIGKVCFSQWFECPFTVDNIIYKTSEHWMMAQKALLFNDRNNFDKIIICNKPGEAKELGRQVLGYDDQIWNDKKFDIVKLGNIHKFNQNPDLAEYLLKTDNRVLVEASPVDTIWGIGLSQDSADIDNIYAWRGQNLLGFVLMEVRDFLRDFGTFKQLNNSMQAPWIRFSKIDCNDMFWRMGQGEDYMVNFSKYYLGLTERERTIYSLTNPSPYDWNGFYD